MEFLGEEFEAGELALVGDAVGVAVAEGELLECGAVAVDDAQTALREGARERFETVASLLHAELGGLDYAAVNVLDGGLLALHRQARVLHEERGELIESVELARVVLGEEGGDGCGSLETGVRHEVQDHLVALMTDASEDRQGEEGDSLVETLVGEAVDVGDRATSADYHHRVKVLLTRGDGCECVHDALFHPVALHD